MRVLVMATPSTTHFASMVPLAWACRAAGHEVHVLGQPDIVGAARGAGLPVTPVGDTFDVVEMIGAALPAGRRPIEAGHGRVTGNQWGPAARTWVLHAKYLVDRYLDAARAWGPDLILSDPLEVSALMIGGVLGIPVVQHRWGVDPLGGPAVRGAQRTFRARAERLGSPGGVPAPAMILDPCPPGVQLPDAPAGVPMRLVPYNGTGRLPAWAAAGTGRRVCVSFGRITPALNGLPLIRTVVDAFDGMDETDGVEAVVAVDAADREALGPVPAAVRLVDAVPLGMFLDSCAAVLHHGGAGTGMTAMAHGLPQLVLPGMMDAFPYSDRITASGAGFGLDEVDSQNDPAAIRAAVLALLDDPRYAAAAAGLRDAMRAMPTPAQTVPVLEKLAATRTVRAA